MCMLAIRDQKTILDEFQVQVQTSSVVGLLGRRSRKMRLEDVKDHR